MISFVQYITNRTNNDDLIRIFYHPWFIYRNMSPLSLYDLKILICFLALPWLFGLIILEWLFREEQGANISNCNNNSCPSPISIIRPIQETNEKQRDRVFRAWDQWPIRSKNCVQETNQETGNGEKQREQHRLKDDIKSDTKTLLKVCNNIELQKTLYIEIKPDFVLHWIRWVKR